MTICFTTPNASLTIWEQNRLLWVPVMDKMVCMAKHDISPPFMTEIFCSQSNWYNFRNDRHFSLSQVRSVMYG